MENLVTKKSPPGEGGGGARKSPTSAQKALIARNLRLAFGEVASEKIPQPMLDLLDKLDQVEVKKS